MNNIEIKEDTLASVEHADALNRIKKYFSDIDEVRIVMRSEINELNKIYWFAYLSQFISSNYESMMNDIEIVLDDAQLEKMQDIIEVEMLGASYLSMKNPPKQQLLN